MLPKAANVAHVVLSSLEDTRGHSKSAPVLGDMPVPHFDGKDVITKYALVSGVPVTSMLTACYYDNLSYLLSKTPNGLIVANNAREGKLAWIAVSDIGQAAAGLFLAGASEWAGKTVGISSQTISFAQLCEEIAKALGQPVNFVPLSDDAYVTKCLRHLVLAVAATGCRARFSATCLHTAAITTSTSLVFALSSRPRCCAVALWSTPLRGALGTCRCCKRSRIADIVTSNSFGVLLVASLFVV
jgi:nucleoside-diphosphate-sugar epimerase